MKLCQVLLLGALPNSIYAWKPFALSARAPSSIKNVKPSSISPLELSPSRLLESSRQNPGFYSAAMLEIKRLEEKPICHRMAAQLLVKNCQGLKDLGVHEYQTASEGMQRHHVESFAASLAMCDMDRARFDIPDACEPFRSYSLETALRTNGKLEATSDELSLCLQGLGQDHSHWSTWLSYRDTSLLLCRGASTDVERDQALELQKQFIKMMEEFTTGLYDDLREVGRQMAGHAKQSNTFYEESKIQMENLKTKFHETFESVTEDIQNANLGVKSVVASTNDAYQMIRNLVNTLIQSNAEMASEQEHAIAVLTNKLKSKLGGVTTVVMENEGRLVRMHDAILLMAATVGNLVERQNTIEESSLKTLHALINATELVQNHEHKLHQASLKAAKISDDLDKVTTNSMRLSSLESRIDWVLRTAIPVATLLGGNYKTVPTTGNNLLLLSIGYTIAESINILRSMDWYSVRAFYFPSWQDSSCDEEESSASSPIEEPTWKGRFFMPEISALPTPTSSETNDEHIETI